MESGREFLSLDSFMKLIETGHETFFKLVKGRIREGLDVRIESRIKCVTKEGGFSDNEDRQFFGTSGNVVESFLDNEG